MDWAVRTVPVMTSSPVPPPAHGWSLDHLNSSLRYKAEDATCLPVESFPRVHGSPTAAVGFRLLPEAFYRTVEVDADALSRLSREQWHRLAEVLVEDLLAVTPPPLTKTSEWSDEPDEGRSEDDWPYPTSHIRSVANGELAARIRRALGADEHAEVVVVEDRVSGGYSEYTQEDDFDITVSAGGREWSTTSCYSSESAFRELFGWLDREAPVEAKP